VFAALRFANHGTRKPGDRADIAAVAVPGYWLPNTGYCF